MPNEPKTPEPKPGVPPTLGEMMAPAGLTVVHPETIAGGAPMALVPTGYKAEIIELESVEPWLPCPLRKTGQFEFADVDSFVRYFNEHKNEDSRIFAALSDQGGGFNGRINFHGAKPSFNDHNCHFMLRPTREWNTWCMWSNKRMAQGAFANFLEENADLFTNPSGAELLELITTLEGRANVLVNSAVKMQTGAIKLAYSEEIELKGGVGTQSGEMLVPALLSVAIAPFEGTSRYSMAARLRYRIENRKIEFWYQPVDPHLVVRHVTADILQAIEKQTGLVPFKT